MTTTLPTLTEAKTQARQLRHDLADQGHAISHASALEQIAHTYGYRGWNGFFAAISNRPPQGWAIGERVSGQYLSQPFTATVIAVEMTRPGWFRLSLDLDQPVDVVTFDSFSNLRKRVNGTVGPLGISTEKTSDGTPHLQIDL
ncbi:glyoxalase superfamily protein [Pacificibacter sp. AS14]|uniref:glyoxalase superfamily protein n=1 Tax=Pacificibacter sp. AS14 TaxID=3135785 RepID=UPI003179FF8A